MQNLIPKNWQRIKLGELGKVITGKTPPTSQKEYFLQDFPFITPSDIENYDVRYGYSTDRFISEKWAAKAKNLRILKNSTCFVCIGSTIGKMCLTRQDSFTNQQINSVVADESKADPFFIYYFLKQNQKEILKEFGGGGAQPIINKNIFEGIELEAPIDISEQGRIASILSAFDDKIEVNNKIAKTLEGMAQGFFKEWFVNFKFPGYKKVEFVGSELGKIPVGWKTGFIRDLGRVITGKTPSTNVKENFGSEIPFITIPDIYKVFITETERYISEKGSRKMQSMLLPAGSICVSCIATVGLVGLTTQQSLTNQQINSIIPSEENLTYFLYIYFKNKKKDLELFGSGGTATLIINKTRFENLDLIIPDKKSLSNFHSIVKPMYEKILSISYENQKLAALRDLLLPKLMKGEIRV